MHHFALFAAWARASKD